MLVDLNMKQCLINLNRARLTSIFQGVKLLAVKDEREAASRQLKGGKTS